MHDLYIKLAFPSTYLSRVTLLSHLEKHEDKGTLKKSNSFKHYLQKM